MPINIVIADDDQLITSSLKIIFDMDDRFNVVGVGGNGQEAVKLCRANVVDVILLDIRMPVLNGVEATKQIVDQTNTKILILTTFDEDDYIKQAFDNGAKGYLLKNTPPEQIMNAIVSIHGGNAVVQDTVMEKMNVAKDNKEKRLEGLTEREKDIVKAIAEGFTNKEIAEHLFISEGTVKNNITAILNKLNLKHRTHIAIHYLKD